MSHHRAVQIAEDFLRSKRRAYDIRGVSWSEHDRTWSVFGVDLADGHPFSGLIDFEAGEYTESECFPMDYKPPTEFSHPPGAASERIRACTLSPQEAIRIAREQLGERSAIYGPAFANFMLKEFHWNISMQTIERRRPPELAEVIVNPTNLTCTFEHKTLD